MVPTSIVLCTGAFHTVLHSEPAVKAFENLGWRCVPSPLQSPGSIPQADTFDRDVSSIRATIIQELESGHDVCVVIHSAAGKMACEAVNSILPEAPTPTKGRLMRLVFLAAFLDWAKTVGHSGTQGQMEIDIERGLMTLLHPYQNMYNDMSYEDARPFLEALTVQPLYEEPQLSSDKWTNVPLTYLVQERDASLPVALQEEIAQEYGMEIARIDAGHCSFASQPERFVQAVRDIIQSTT